MQEMLDFLSSPEPFEKEHLEDSKQPIKVGAPFDESSVMIAVVVSDSAERVLLTNCEDPSTDPVWYIPSGDVENGECLISAAKRHFLAETAMELINVRIASIENYPSLRRNFIRFIAIGELPESSSEEISDASQWRWFPIGDLASDSISLLSMDIQSIIKTVAAKDAKAASLTPTASSSPLHYLSVQIGLVIDKQILVVRKSPENSWRLPFTFADYRSGESLLFASQRVVGRLLNILPDIVGVVDIRHGFRSDSTPVEGCLGSCITVLAHSKHDMEKAKSILGGSLDYRLWQFMSLDDALRLADNENTQQIINRCMLGQCISMRSV